MDYSSLMRRARHAGLALVLLAAGGAGAAEDSGHSHMMHMTTPDQRRALDFPPPMREHMLSQMRAHLEALQEAMQALASHRPAEAGEIAETRLGLSAPGAASCAPAGGRPAEGMAAMMGAHMPEEMRALGFSMHQAASDFATEAKKIAPDGDVRPALAALAGVTEACVACHSAFRLR
jgi:hypothetical protein